MKVCPNIHWSVSPLTTLFEILDVFVAPVSDDVAPVAHVQADGGDDHAEEHGDEANDHA